MNALRSARVTVVGIAGTPLRLAWLQDIEIPADVSLEIADADVRVDLVVSRGQEHVALVVNGRSGQVVAEERNTAGSELVVLAHRVAAGRSGGRGLSPAPSDDAEPPARIIFENLNWPPESRET